MLMGYKTCESTMYNVSFFFSFFFSVMFGVLQVIDRNLILKHVPPAHQNNKLKVFIVQYPVNYSISNCAGQILFSNRHAPVIYIMKCTPVCFDVIHNRCPFYFELSITLHN